MSLPRIYLLNAAAFVLAGCATASSPRECTHVYTLGDASIAAAVASGQPAIKPGPLPPSAVPPNAPSGALESDGSYAGGRVFCSVREANAALSEARGKGIVASERQLRVYELKASWTKDVYELRTGDYRLQRSALMLRTAD